MAIGRERRVTANRKAGRVTRFGGGRDQHALRNWQDTRQSTAARTTPPRRHVTQLRRRQPPGNPWTTSITGARDCYPPLLGPSPVRHPRWRFFSLPVWRSPCFCGTHIDVGQEGVGAAQPSKSQDPSALCFCPNGFRNCGGHWLDSCQSSLGMVCKAGGTAAN